MHTVVSPVTSHTTTRRRVIFNDSWSFHRNDPTGSSGDGDPSLHLHYDDSDWRRILLPHDWGVEEAFDIHAEGGTGKLHYQGAGWYRKKFHIPKADSDQEYHLEIDGAMSRSSVWVNGVHAGGWAYGYSSFDVELTPHLNFGGENVIAIRLENPDESSRWYPGGGLYRNTWLRRSPRVRVAHRGVHVTTPIVEAKQAVVALDIELENHSIDNTRLDVVAVIRRSGSDVVDAQCERANVTIGAGGSDKVSLELSISAPTLWNLENPERYTAEVLLKQDDEYIDRYSVPFGIRSIRFDAKSGFWLNNKLVRLNGVCMHHDLGPLGAALNIRAMERQLEILQEMGCNAIRCSHNPPSPEWLDLCDHMGFLVINELTDCWTQGKKRNDYHSIFEQWVERDIEAWVRRDRNHPCVILWSTGNEIAEQKTEAGAKLSSKLRQMVRAHDTTRGVTAGMHFLDSGFNGFEQTLDVFGWNYKPRHYSRFVEANPDIPLIGSETASCLSSRGEYFFPVSSTREDCLKNYQVSSYDLHFPRWASTPDTEFEHQDRNPNIAGEFVWTGFDYLGEPTPYNADLSNLLNAQNEDERARIIQDIEQVGKLPFPSRSSYFGIMDLCGFKKDRFYLYQSRWHPDLKFAHILPHWNWPERVGEVTPVHVYTSGDEAELFVNGKSQGRQSRKEFEYRFCWNDVIYEPGEVQVVTHKDGSPWAQTKRETTGKADAIQLVADRPKIHADALDIAFVTVQLVDEFGRLVPREKSLVEFSIIGPGELVAVDNGDPTRLDLFYAKECRVFNGLALATLRFKPGASSPFELVAKCDGLKSASLRIEHQDITNMAATRQYMLTKTDNA